MTASSPDLSPDLVIPVRDGVVRLPGFNGLPARVDRNEREIREVQHDGLRLAENQSATSVLAHGHRELAELVTSQHKATARTLARLQSLVVTLVAESGMRLNDVAPGTSLPIVVCVLLVTFLFPEIGDLVVARIAKLRGGEKHEDESADKPRSGKAASK